MGKKLKNAVILAAGRGSRMKRMKQADASLSPQAREIADKGLKGLIPVGGRPFIYHIIRRLSAAGICRIIFVVAPDADELRAGAAITAAELGVNVDFAVQASPRGTADAVLACEKAVGSSPFLLCNADNLYPQDALSRLISFPNDTCAVAGFDRDVLTEHNDFDKDRVKSFSVLNISDKGRLIGIVEKPESPEDFAYKGKLWVGMNLYRFTPAIFDACKNIEAHPVRGELELPAAVSKLIAAPGARVELIFSSGAVYDLTEKKDIGAVHRALSANPDIS